jgi:hypothetical protein
MSRAGIKHKFSVLGGPKKLEFVLTETHKRQKLLSEFVINEGNVWRHVDSKINKTE